jgi:hypothetical protein
VSGCSTTQVVQPAPLVSRCSAGIGRAQPLQPPVRAGSSGVRLGSMPGCSIAQPLRPPPLSAKALVRKSSSNSVGDQLGPSRMICLVRAAPSSVITPPCGRRRGDGGVIIERTNTTSWLGDKALAAGSGQQSGSGHACFGSGRPTERFRRHANQDREPNRKAQDALFQDGRTQ